VAGAEHVPAYVDGHWDGKVHLLKFNSKAGHYMIPTGLLDTVRGVFRDTPETDKRKEPDPFGPRIVYNWIGPQPRTYQEEVIASVMDLVEVGEAPRGILQVPIRGGKTLIAAQLIMKLGWPTVFVVESDLLLKQTVKAFKEYLDFQSYKPNNKLPWIGECGSGLWQPGLVTIAMIQTMIRQPQKTSRLLENVNLMLLDECHHFKADEWREPILKSNTWGRIGLSATLFEDPSIPQERSMIWVRAATGPILCQIPVKRLIDEGHLVQPWVAMYPIHHINAPKGWNYGATYEELIVENITRNGIIADLAQDAANKGALTLVDTGRLSQMRHIQTMLETREVPCDIIHGKTPSNKRQEILKRFRNREIAVIIGTILGEGVDVPELEIVINAEGGKSRIAVMQRLRNLTVSSGKHQAVVIDFADIGQKHLSEHASERLEQYVATDGFRLRVIEDLTRPATIPTDLLATRIEQ
jgi:superfamily II DNA or RNA helicase